MQFVTFWVNLNFRNTVTNAVTPITDLICTLFGPYAAMFVNRIYPWKSLKTSFVSPGKCWNLIFASPGKSWKTVFLLSVWTLDAAVVLIARRRQVPRLDESLVPAVEYAMHHCLVRTAAVWRCLWADSLLTVRSKMPTHISLSFDVRPNMPLYFCWLIVMSQMVINFPCYLWWHLQLLVLLVA